MFNDDLYLLGEAIKSWKNSARVHVTDTFRLLESFEIANRKLCDWLCARNLIVFTNIGRQTHKMTGSQEEKEQFCTQEMDKQCFFSTKRRSCSLPVKIEDEVTGSDQSEIYHEQE